MVWFVGTEGGKGSYSSPSGVLCVPCELGLIDCLDFVDLCVLAEPARLGGLEPDVDDGRVRVLDYVVNCF